MLARFPDLVEKIGEAYAAVCLLVGEFAVAQVQAEDLYRRGLGAGPDGIEAARMNFVPMVAAILEKKGLRQLATQGFYGLLPAWGMVQEDHGFMQEHPGMQIDPQKYYAWQQAQARAKFGREFQDKGDMT
jgi:hypothetical protein